MAESTRYALQIYGVRSSSGHDVVETYLTRLGGEHISPPLAKLCSTGGGGESKKSRRPSAVTKPKSNSASRRVFHWNESVLAFWTWRTEYALDRGGSFESVYVTSPDRNVIRIR